MSDLTDPVVPVAPRGRHTAVWSLEVAQRVESATVRSTMPNDHGHYDENYRRIRAQILAGRPTCTYCPAPATTTDHVIPIASGLPRRVLNRPGNLVPACQPCNTRRGSALSHGRPFVAPYSASGW